MPRLFQLTLLLLLFSLCGSALAGQPKNLSAAEAIDLLRKQKNVFLLDVRTTEEHRQGHLDGAHLIPIDQLLNRIGELPRNRPILIYCAVGSRSSQVAAYLARAGYAEVYNMYGGIWAWQLRGYPIKKGS